MESSDTDLRFMATNDLMLELEKNRMMMDNDSEKHVVALFLRRLEDPSGEIQNLVVKWMGFLVTKVRINHAEAITQCLCQHLLSNKLQLRDISCVGLKIVIGALSEAPAGFAERLCSIIVGALAAAISQEEETLQLEALDIVSELLSKANVIGTTLSPHHDIILSSILPKFRSKRQAIRKRSISVCATLSKTINDRLYFKLIDDLYGGVRFNTPDTQRSTSIQCVVAVCRQSGHRFCEYVDRFAPFILQFCHENDDELRAYCLQACEAFITKCPKEINTHIPYIVNLCLKYIKHDPNYVNEDDALRTNLTGNESENEEIEDFSDDDDISWKVRRSSVQCYTALISSRMDLLCDFYKTLSSPLLCRFNEREENVKSCIFYAYITLLKRTKEFAVKYPESNCMDKKSPLYLLQQEVPSIVTSVYSQMNVTSIKTRLDCFELLKELCGALPGALTVHIEKFIPCIQYSFGDIHTNSILKISTLSFIHCLLSSHPPATFFPFVHLLFPVVINCVKDNFYKITSEALSVLQEFVKVVRPLDTPTCFNFVPFVDDSYAHTLIKLRATDIDQEVKDRAITTMGEIICHFGDYLSDKLSDCLPLFVDKLNNEITRLCAVKALYRIVGSPLKVSLMIIKDVMPILGSLLRKNQRALKFHTLLLLNFLIIKYSKQQNPDLLQHVIIELPLLLDESDLNLARLAFIILKSIAEVCPKALARKNMTKLVLPKIMNLLQSPLLQGDVLSALLEFFESVVVCRIPDLSFNKLINMLLFPINTLPENQTLHRQVYSSLAKCVATLIIKCIEKATSVLQQFILDMQSPRSECTHAFALLVIGEIGCKIDLTTAGRLEQDIAKAFSATSDDIKFAASYALGNVCIGNLSFYLPMLLNEIQNQGNHQYLLLHSLNEIIKKMSLTSESLRILQFYLPAIWQRLFFHCDCTEDGTRSVVAECIGRVTLIDPATFLPKLQESLSSPLPLLRATVVTAIKFTISNKPQPIDPLLHQCIGQFLNTLQDTDSNVRGVALVALNSAARNKPSLIKDSLNSILPLLYNGTKVRGDLVWEVEMGPFKHTVDQGMPVRRAAFECMYTLLDTLRDGIDMFEFLGYLENGLRDHHDIKILTHLIIARVAELSPNVVILRMGGLVESLRVSCTTKLNAHCAKQEHDKQEELKRSCMRLVASLIKVPDSHRCLHLRDFVTLIENSSDLHPILQSFLNGDNGNSTGACMDLS